MGICACSKRRASIRIRLRVGGFLKPSLAVEHVRIDDATVTYTIHNTGNAILSARQTASLSGPFGRWNVRERNEQEPLWTPETT